MAEVESVDPERSYAVASDPGGLWILPEPWKTPARPEIDGGRTLAFPTAPWTGCARPQAPQAQLHLSSGPETG